MRPVCVNCNLEMYCHKNGVMVVYRWNLNNTADIHEGDIYKCPCCGTEITTGYGRMYTIDRDTLGNHNNPVIIPDDVMRGK